MVCDPELLVFARGLKTLTSKKNLSNQLPHTPSAATSSLAPGAVLDERCMKCLPDKGCNIGSIETLWHTSDK